MSSLLDWRAIVRADVDAIRPDSDSGKTSTNIEMHTPAHQIVERAAQARRMTTASYMRRAAMAFAAYDAGIDVLELFAMEPRVTRETGTGMVDPEGTGFGDWRIKKLEPSS